MAFRFEYVGLTTSDFGCGQWVAPGVRQWALLGRLSSGELKLGEHVLLPTASGIPFRGYAARFTESFSEYLALPYVYTLNAEMMSETAFCLCVGGQPGEPLILCPGIACSED